MVNRQKDMEVVGEVLNREDILLAASDTEAHAVILTLGFLSLPTRPFNPQHPRRSGQHERALFTR